MTQVNQTEFTLAAPDFSEALNFFTQRLGFRVEMIVPADAPHTAVLSGQGMSLRLTSASNAADTAHLTDGTHRSLSVTPKQRTYGIRGGPECNTEI